MARCGKDTGRRQQGHAAHAWMHTGTVFSVEQAHTQTCLIAGHVEDLEEELEGGTDEGDAELLDEARSERAALLPRVEELGGELRRGDDGGADRRLGASSGDMTWRFANVVPFASTTGRSCRR